MTSNVGQNYPYSSETEAQRAAAIGSLVESREGLADKLSAETTPVDERPDRGRALRLGLARVGVVLADVGGHAELRFGGRKWRAGDGFV